jgi:dienelactone hydrolase
MHVAAPGADAVDLMLHVWYPAEEAVGRRAPYIDGWDRARETLTAPVQRLFRDAYGEFEQGRIVSYASENTRPLNGRHPVLLFAHGLGVPTFAYTAQMEELASHGYVVAAVEYSPAAAFVLFPDGRVGTMDADKWNALGKMPQDSPELLERERAEIEGGVRALRRAIDHLERANASGPLVGRLDLQRLGAFGHSFGAMAVLRTLQVDRRLRAGMTQDAFGPSVIAYAAADGQQMTSKVALFFPSDRRQQQTEGRPLLQIAAVRHAPHHAGESWFRAHEFFRHAAPPRRRQRRDASQCDPQPRDRPRHDTIVLRQRASRLVRATRRSTGKRLQRADYRGAVTFFMPALRAFSLPAVALAKAGTVRESRE